MITFYALKQTARRLGVPGGIGVVLVLAWCIWHVFVLPQQWAALDQLRQQLRRPAIQTVALKPVVTHAVLDWSRFPSMSQLGKVHQQLHAAAFNSGFVLPEVQFKTHPLAATSLDVLDIDLSFTATYVQFKKWLALLMVAEPAMSVQHLSLQRTNAQQSALEIKLRLQWCAQRLDQEHVGGGVNSSVHTNGEKAPAHLDMIQERLKNDQQSIKQVTDAL